MRSLLLFLSLAILSFSSCGQKDKKIVEEKPAKQEFVFPEKPIGWVSDFEKILTQSQVDFLDSIIQLHEKQTTNEIAVATYEPDTSDIKTIKDFDKFSSALFNKWGVGKKDKNNGVGILISIKFRKIRIETGLGLEAKLTSTESKNIIDTIILPEFKKEQYFSGILNGLNAIFKEIE